MIYYILDLIIVLIILGLGIGLSFMKVFVLQINLINAAVLGSFSGVFLYIINRYTDVLGLTFPFDFTIHPALCLIGGIVIFFLSALAQRTKIGFWIFAIVFSIGWALALAGIVYYFTKDWIWFWVTLVVAVIFNFIAHLRSRKLKVDVTQSLIDS